MRTAVVALLLIALAGAIAASPATALQRSVVYSKTVEGDSPTGEGFVLEGGLYALRGKRPRRLTYDPADAEPNVARDGTIAFARNGDLYAVRPDGSGLRQLTAGPEIDERPLFSSDGRSLVFTRRAVEKAPRDLYAVSLDDPTARPLTASAEDEREASFSRDGKGIVFVVGGDLFSVRIDGTGLRQLTRTPELELSPHYFVGGVLFNRRRSTSAPAVDIYAMRRDGTQVRPLVVKAAAARIEVVSPDGRLLVFRSRDRIWTKRLAVKRSFSARKVDGPSAGTVYDLALSPDKRKVAFLFYFEEMLALCSVDLRTGDFDTLGEHYNEGGEGGIDPRIAW